jgi:hypothetical protein
MSAGVRNQGASMVRLRFRVVCIRLPVMGKPLPYDPERLAHCAREIIVSGRELAARGWTPATSSKP